MRFEELLEYAGGWAWFDFATLVQLSAEPREHLRTRLYAWRRAGRVIALRRGMYTLAETYRRTRLNPAALSNALYAPSYLSRQWALSWYGLIPEMTAQYTAVTTRRPRTFENPYGRYRYRHLKRSAFFGYRSVETGGASVLMAHPEKALLDLWYLDSGEWTLERMESMRFQNTEVVDSARLEAFARQYDSPRLRRAAGVWTLYAEEVRGGGEVL
ncbi:type IV toxin-antitoxin system AbiEi family antitoxin domain-containing protein [Kiritimatiella glycovorans]|uniref:Transcriptional regulator, AbiEi antitoxin, Type IV TA system n=1 Tax=Kiritimatiella glycovorans TaxID=1307763 RepID=A0A0G3EIA4_9BACT|nr:hypothetical protein [Kiritimatiella glycovorans]AKJ64545.1 hypothetical protein L21SP4_01297 [Kiritimatiella glycovorans]